MDMITINPSKNSIEVDFEELKDFDAVLNKKLKKNWVKVAVELDLKVIKKTNQFISKITLNKSHFLVLKKKNVQKSLICSVVDEPVKVNNARQMKVSIAN